MIKKKVAFYCGDRAFARIPRMEHGSVDAGKMAERVATARLYWGGRGGMSWAKIKEEARTPNFVPMSVPFDDYRMMAGVARECCPHEQGFQRSGNLSRLLRLALLYDAQMAVDQPRSEGEK